MQDINAETPRAQNNAEGSEAKSTGTLHENQIPSLIIGAAIEVHRYYGPGLIEQIYEASLCQELNLRGIFFRRQQPVPIYLKLLSYLRLSKLRLGLIINFHAAVLKDGIVRVINELAEYELPPHGSFKL